MAHFAKLDSNNIVTNVVRVNNEVILKADGTESELKGKQFLNNLLGSATWVQTSYNGNIRARYAGVGMTYDSANNVFITEQPFPSWTLNETTWDWDSPVPYPTVEEGSTDFYTWNEDAQSWDLVVIEEEE